MLTKQSVVKSSNDNCIIASISSLIENSSLNASSIMLSKNDIDNMKTVFPDLTTVIQHFIYSLSRQFSAHVIAFLAEASKYIDDEKLSSSIVDYCKKIDNDAIQIMSFKEYEDFQGEIRELILNWYTKKELEDKFFYKS